MPNRRRVREVHRCILACINHGFVRADDIQAILWIIDVTRVSRALGDLVDFGMVEISQLGGTVGYTEDFARALVGCGEASDQLDFTLGAEVAVIDDPGGVAQVLSALGVGDPARLSRNVQVVLVRDGE